MYGSKKMKDSDTFEKKPKPSKSSAPKRPSKKEESEGLYEETQNIKEGGLRKSLKVDKDYKFTKSVVAKLLKNEVGKKFEFQNKSFMMNEKLRKQLQLALNMLKN